MAGFETFFSLNLAGMAWTVSMGEDSADCVTSVASDRCSRHPSSKQFSWYDWGKKKCVLLTVYCAPTWKYNISWKHWEDKLCVDATGKKFGQGAVENSFLIYLCVIARAAASLKRERQSTCNLNLSIVEMSISLVSNQYLDETSAKIRSKPVPWEVKHFCHRLVHHS